MARLVVAYDDQAIRQDRSRRDRNRHGDVLRQTVDSGGETRMVDSRLEEDQIAPCRVGRRDQTHRHGGGILLRAVRRERNPGKEKGGALHSYKGVARPSASRRPREGPREKPREARALL